LIATDHSNKQNFSEITFLDNDSVEMKRLFL